MKFGMSPALASLAALIAVVVTGCSADESLGAVDTHPAAVAQRSSPAKAPHARANRRGAAVPPELRADYIRAVQAQAGDAYRVEPAGADTLRAHSAAQGLLTELSPEGVRLLPTESGSTSASASASLSLSGFGCEQQLEAVSAAVPRAEGNRVEYARGELVEWYVNGPLGLEQGFTLAAPPACRAQGGGPVVLELALGGELYAELVDQGAGVELRDSTGRVVLRYTDLFARDAAGRTVAATMTLEGERLSLHVEDGGAVYPLEIDPLIWAQQDKLLPSDGAAGDRFGRAVAISGDTAVVGAVLDDDNGSFSGSAYVFVRNGSSWTEQARLVPADGAAGDEFGFAVAISGDTAVVGAVLDDDNGSFSGSAYVFVRSGSSWTEQAKLVPADGAASDEFGSAVAISGDTAMVGSIFDDDNGSFSGSAYVFVRSGSSWTEQDKLLAADGGAGDRFGNAVAISGDTAVVGALFDDDNSSDSGSAYVFVRSGSSWTQHAKLTAADGAADDNFGQAVALSGDTAVVGRSSTTTTALLRARSTSTRWRAVPAGDGGDRQEGLAAGSGLRGPSASAQGSFTAGSRPLL